MPGIMDLSVLRSLLHTTEAHQVMVAYQDLIASRIALVDRLRAEGVEGASLLDRDVLLTGLDGPYPKSYSSPHGYPCPLPQSHKHDAARFCA